MLTGIKLVFTFIMGFLVQTQISIASINVVSIQTSKHGMPPFAETAGATELSTINLAVLGQLMVLDDGFNAHPSLLKAAHYDYKRDVYVLRLRNGLKFHNGRLATSADLEFSLVRGFFSTHQSFYKTYIGNIDGINAVSGQRYRSGAVSGVRVVDPLTVEVKLASANPSFLPSLVNPYFSLVPQEELDDSLLTWKKYPVGVGPYRVVAPGYHDGQVTIEKIDQGTPGPQRVAIYSADVLPSYDISLLSVSSVLSPVEVQRELAGAVTTVFFSNANPLGSNPHFRKAMSLLIDRSKLVAGAKGSLATHEMLPKRFWGRVTPGEVLNLDAARKEIAQIPKDLVQKHWRFSVYMGGNSSPETDFINRELSRQMGAVGLNIAAEFTKDKFIGEKPAKTYPFFVKSRISDYIDPLIMFASLRKGGHDRYLAPINDAEFERLFAAASQSKLHDDRVATVKRLSTHVIEQNICIPMLERHFFMYFNKGRVKSLGIQRSPIIFDVRGIEQ